jgi:hypothetical protein
MSNQYKRYQNSKKYLRKLDIRIVKEAIKIKREDVPERNRDLYDKLFPVIKALGERIIN